MVLHIVLKSLVLDVFAACCDTLRYFLSDFQQYCWGEEEI